MSRRKRAGKCSRGGGTSRPQANGVRSREPRGEREASSLEGDDYAAADEAAELSMEAAADGGRSAEERAKECAESGGRVGRWRDAASWRNGWLRPRDQSTLAALVAASLVAQGCWWWSGGGLEGGLHDVDRAPVRHTAFQVDVNRASIPELSQLPGVGPKLAARWVAERELRGDFVSIGDLERIEGIGPLKLERIRPFLAPWSEADLDGPRAEGGVFERNESAGASAGLDVEVTAPAGGD